MPNISSNSTELNGLCAALTNPTELAFKKKNIKNHYPVNFALADYQDAEEAYQDLKFQGNGQLKPFP